MSVKAPQPGVKIRCHEEADIAAILKLVDACYGEAAEPPEYWMWRYFGLEAADSEIYLADQGGEIIGMQPMTFFRHTLRNKPLVGTVLTGVMVHPDHRRKGIFRALIKACVETAWRRGADFVTTMPNDLAYPGFMKLGWFDPGDRTLLVRPLDLIAAARSKVRPGSLGSVVAAMPQIIVRVLSPRHFSSNLRVLNANRFDAAVDDLAERVAAAYDGLVLRRDSAWLNWRYVANPMIHYERFEARSGEGHVRGVAATTVQTWQGIRVGCIVELIGETAKARCSLISSAVYQLAKDGAHIVIAVMSDPDYIADLRNQGFCKIPKYLSPKKFHTVYIPHPDKLELLAPMEQIENWHQTLGDWDGI